MDKLRIHSRSFHRIRNGETHYFGENHFMGIDPLDHSKFHELYEMDQDVKETSTALIVREKPETESLMVIE